MKQNSVKATVANILPAKNIEHRRAIIAQYTTPTLILSTAVRLIPFQKAVPNKTSNALGLQFTEKKMEECKPNVASMNVRTLNVHRNFLARPCSKLMTYWKALKDSADF